MGLRYLGNIIRPGYNPLASNITTGVNTAQYQGVFTLQQQAQAQNTQAWTTDPIFDYTTLLLQSDNAANGSQNNTFLDSSSNSFAITRNGNTTQGSFTPFSLQPGAWSAYLTSVYGSSTFTSRTLFNGNSTIELWVYPNALSGQQTFVRGGGVNFGTNGARLRLDDGVNAGSVFESIGTIVPNVWNHVAVVRTSNTFAFYINGNLDSSNASISSFYTSNATDLNTGAFNSGGSNAFAGYLSNIRVSNVARTISVPSIPYSSDANTVWLIFQSNRFVDNSSNAYALTFVGTPSVQAFSPFAPQFQWTPSVIGGSGYFDGSGDFLTVPYSTTDFDWFTSNVDYTIEAWIMVTGAGWQTSGAPALVGNMQSGGAINYWSFGINGSLQPLFYYYNGGTVTLTLSSVTGTFNQWMHLALCKTNSGIQLFANGVGGTVTAISGTPQSSSGIPLTIGQYNGVGCFGYVSGLRIVKGTALYSGSTYTIPTAPPTPITNTELLTNFTNAGIVDGTMKNNLETVGNAQVSTAVVKYGSGSMFFDGTGDYLRIPTSQTNSLSSGDWTIEFWIYRVGSGNQIFYDQRSTATQVAVTIYNDGSNILQFFVNGANRITGPTFPSSIWTHVTVSKFNSSTRMFVNGVQVGSTYADTNTYVNNPIFVGAQFDGSGTLNGYIDDLRVTTGIARYTQNFIPPSVALPRQ